MDDLIVDFIAETREGLEALDSELVRFEQQPDDPGLLSGIFRLIHTIKGTCGFLGLSRLQTVAHAAENVLGAFRDGDLQVTPTAVSAILDTVDVIRSLIESLAIEGCEPAGDDSALIARLEAVLAPGAPEPSVLAGDGPSDVELVDNRPLIARLGGDATLDAAAEMALRPLETTPELGRLFEGADPDRLQSAIREGYCAAARATQGEPPMSVRLAAFAQGPLSTPDLDALHAIYRDALASLEVDPLASQDLIDRVRAAEPAIAAVAEPVADPVAAPVIAGAPAPPSPSAPPPAAAPVADAEVAGQTQTIRVSVEALEHLMTVVSELVLIRNQLIQTLRLEPESPFAAPLNRLNQVTSELQEGVMTTRMQPISGAWAKLPRLVRDLSQDLGKKIELVLQGQETELDRQVLELIKDPLTHMIRNAADHGLETPAERLAAGKSETGRISLQARHEGGAIVIEVADDGRGLSAEKIRAKAISSGLMPAAQVQALSDAEVQQLIFAAGFSTAGTVTAVSGRGVGMDVVRTNIEKIGGAIELASVEGGGTRFIIRIPLTLTIVSALIVECCGERFAMPQSSVVELVSASDSSNHTIEHINGAAVLRLRDRLLPLVPLQKLLGLEAEKASRGETCIVVARVGAFTFGVVVDRVFDTEEIVVKPVASVLRHLKLYSGATILGDGSVILILDFKGMSVETGAGQAATSGSNDEAADKTAQEPLSSMLVFRAANDALKAAPLASVARIEEISRSQIERVDGRVVIQYRGKLMPIAGFDDTGETTWSDDSPRPLLVFARDDQSVGLLVNEIVDIVETSLASQLKATSPGVIGSLTIAGSATELIDVDHYWRAMASDVSAVAAPAASPLPLTATAPPAARPSAGASKRVLVVDQSPFCQLLLRPLMQQAGYDLTVVSSPAEALSLHDSGESFNLILVDTGAEADQARALANALAQAKAWHATPLMGLGVHTVGSLGDQLAYGAGLVEAVEQTLQPARSAA